MKILYFFIFLWVIFTLLDPNPEFECGSGSSNSKLMRIRIRNPDFLCKKFYNSLKIGPIFFSSALQNKIIYNFVKFAATKKGMTTNFFHPFLFVAVFGSEIQDPGWVKIRIQG
jgi:hypothetical protein